MHWAAAFFFWVASCNVANPNPNPGLDAEASAHTMALETVRLDRFEHDELRYRTRVARVLVDRESGRLDGERIEISTLRRDGYTTTTVTAPRGQAQRDLGRVVLTGGVTVSDDSGRVLTTEALTYDFDDGLLTSTSTVVLRGRNFKVTGARVRGHPRADRIDVDGPLSSHVEPSSGRP